MSEHGFFNMDCMVGMGQYPDKYFGLAIVDPPLWNWRERREKSHPQ